VVLRGVAKILRRTARDTDLVARYGGEEFVVLMPETDTAGAKVIAERIRKEVEAATFETELGPLKVTISLGVATFPDSASAKQELVDKSDQCLYFAKHHGRNKSITVGEMEAGNRKAVVA
jgi:two-component system, cell cycle response regulator